MFNKVYQIGSRKYHIIKSSKHICRPEFAFSIILESVRVAVFCFCVLYRMQTKEPIGLGMRLHLPQTDTYDCLSVKLSTIISIFGHLGCVLGSVTHQKFKECFWIVEAWSWSLVHQAKARLAGPNFGWPHCPVWEDITDRGILTSQNCSKAFHRNYVIHEGFLAVWQSVCTTNIFHLLIKQYCWGTYSTKYISLQSCISVEVTVRP